MKFADHDIVTQRYFFPMEVPFENPTYVDVDGARLACFHADFGHEKTVVYFHGNGEVVADYLPGFADLMNQLGVNLFLAEYRGYGMSTGTPRLAQTLEDVPAIFNAIGKEAAELVVFGRSIGSIYAIEFASRYAIGGLVLESGIADVHERIVLRARPEELGATAESLRQEFDELFDHRSKLGAYDGPVLVLHAQNDHLVSVEHAHKNAEWAGDRTKLVVLPNGDHNTIFHANAQAYLAELRTFVRAL